jgi:hypothetical protein
MGIAGYVLAATLHAETFMFVLLFNIVLALHVAG